MSWGYHNSRYRCYPVEDVYWFEDTEEEHTVIAIEREHIPAVIEMLLRCYTQDEDSERIRVHVAEDD